jgi:Flp pilus assembly pilin Flp
MISSSFACRLKVLARRASAEDGQALVEYSLLLALIAVVAFGAVNEFGLGVSNLYSQIVSGVKAGMP